MSMKCTVVVTDPRRLGGILAATQALSAEVTAVVAGPAELAEQVAGMGVAAVKSYVPEAGVPVEALAAGIAADIAADAPAVLLSNDAPAARMVAGAAAGAMDASVIGQVVKLSAADGAAMFTAQVGNGVAVSDVKPAGAAYGIYVGEDAEVASATPVAVQQCSASAIAARILETDVAGGDAVKLADAPRIVGVGRGVMRREDLPVVEDLVAALGAEIACTLPISEDSHWFPAERVLGSSHNQAAPELYVAVGISGSPNHMSGVRDSKVIVAINQDPDAGVFKRCDYGVVGDLYKVVPALAEAVRNHG